MLHDESGLAWTLVAVMQPKRPDSSVTTTARVAARFPCPVPRAPPLFGSYTGPGFAYFSIQSITCWYQKIEFCGFRIQWFSFG